jgi:hypothetical protein
VTRLLETVAAIAVTATLVVPLVVMAVARG